jgi:hypothetical protein
MQCEYEKKISPHRIVVLHGTGNPGPQGLAGSIPAVGGLISSQNRSPIPKKFCISQMVEYWCFKN